MSELSSLGRRIQHRIRYAGMGRLLRRLVFAPLDALATSLTRIPPRSGEVLVVRLDAIGDFVVWCAVAAQFRVLYPGARLVLAANSIWAPLASRLPYWDEVLPIEVARLYNDPRYRWRCLVSVRQRGFSVAVQPTRSRSSLAGDAVVRSTGAPDRIGSAWEPGVPMTRERRAADRGYSRLVSTASATTEMAHNRLFLIELGWPADRPLAARLPSVGDPPSSIVGLLVPYFVIFPGASWSGRQWPAERFAQVIDALRSRHPTWQAVTCGSAAERSLCERIGTLADRPVLNLAGETSLAEFAELVRGARLLIGNETSGVHMAAAVGTPSVCVLGGGHFGRFVPYPEEAQAPVPEPVFEPMACFGCNWICSQPHRPGEPVPCVARLEVNRVVAAAVRILA